MTNLMVGDVELIDIKTAAYLNHAEKRKEALREHARYELTKTQQKIAKISNEFSDLVNNPELTPEMKALANNAWYEMKNWHWRDRVNAASTADELKACLIEGRAVLQRAADRAERIQEMLKRNVRFDVIMDMKQQIRRMLDTNDDRLLPFRYDLRKLEKEIERFTEQSAGGWTSQNEAATETAFDKLMTEICNMTHKYMPNGWGTSSTCARCDYEHNCHENEGGGGAKCG